jgi:hypothetical protein
MKGLLLTRECGMTMVWGDPAGFAVDWDWQRGLTVRELAGRRSEPRFDRKVLEHELPARPAGERQARAAARRWWQTQGHAQALSAARGNVKQPGSCSQTARNPAEAPGCGHPQAICKRLRPGWSSTVRGRPLACRRDGL